MRYIARAYGGADFALLTAALRAHGVRFFEADFHTAVTVSHMTHAVGGLRLAVLDQDFEEATNLLADGLVPEWRGPSWPLAIFLAVVLLFSGVPPNAVGVFWRQPDLEAAEGPQPEA